MEYSHFLTDSQAGTVRKLWGELVSHAEAPEDTATRICGLLQDANSSGVVVTGPAGSGRRAAVESAMDSLPDAPRLIRLNGSNFGTKSPLGALSFLLAQVDIAPDATRHEVMRALGELLCPQGRASVVMLGRPELIDGQSSSLLAQLASIGKIKLAVISDQVQKLPEDLFAVYRSGMLKMVSVGRMDSAQTREFLERELKGPVSAYVASTLCYLTAGNRSITRKLLRSWCANGQILESNGVWILHLSELGSGPALHSLFNSLVSGLDDAENELLAALALGGPVSLDRIHQAGLSLPLDGLAGRGLVKNLLEPANCVGIGIPVLSLLLRSEIAVDDKPVDPSILESLHADPLAARIHAGMQRSADMGSFQAIVTAGEFFADRGYASEGWRQDSVTRATILRLHAKALTVLGQPHRALALIREALAGLAKARAVHPHSQRLLLASQQIDVLRELISLTCEHTAADAQPAGSNALTAESTQWLDEPLRLRALATQAVKWSAHSRQDDAQQLVHQVDAELHTLRLNGTLDLAFTRDDVTEIEYLLLQSELMGANWNAAATRAEHLAAGHGTDSVIMAHADLVRGLMLALNDKHEAALRVLEPSLEQLCQVGNSAAHDAVEAAVSYCRLALARPAEISGTVVPEPQPVSGAALDVNSWLAALFSSLSLSMMGDTARAQARLLAFADLAHEQDHPVFESLALAYSLRLGHWEAITALERSSLRCQGSLGQMLLRLALAVGHGDSTSICHALQELASSGRILLATSARNELVSRLDGKDQRLLSKAVNSQMRAKPAAERGVSTPAEAAQERTPLWARELTKREVQIAQWAIGGKSNQEIAKFNGVSIRTVEGHLYQVYAKLQVRNRQELTALDRASRRSVVQR